MINWHNGQAPTPPYIASIFHYYLSDNLEGYAEFDDLTMELAKQSPGFLGYESFKHNGRGSFISYWQNMDAVRHWASNPEHIKAKQLGIKKWYKYYHSSIAEVQLFNQHEL
jgi:heme-degrading monooxygenase HmoA